MSIRYVLVLVRAAYVMAEDIVGEGRLVDARVFVRLEGSESIIGDELLRGGICIGRPVSIRSAFEGDVIEGTFAHHDVQQYRSRWL